MLTPAGVTVAIRASQAIKRSICCCTSTVSKYVPYIIQRLICCMCTANVMLDSGTNSFASSRVKGAYRARVQPRSALLLNM